MHDSHLDAHVQIAPQVHFLFVRLLGLLGGAPSIPDHLRQRVVLGAVEQGVGRRLLFDEVRSVQVAIGRRVYVIVDEPMAEKVAGVIATTTVVLGRIATRVAVTNGKAIAINLY